MNVPHSPAFFDQMRTCREPYRLLAECYHDALPLQNLDTEPRTALDLGCGTGAQTARLAELGWTAVGVDVFDVGPEPGFAFRKIDLLEVPARLRYDAVICTETAEHVTADRADALVAAVTSRAERAIIWSAAPPGTEWEGHVNCQPAEYWLGKLRAFAWVPQVSQTSLLRSLMVERRAQHWMAPGNFWVLHHGGAGGGD